MPRPVEGEGHVKRWNKKQPPITFRCPNPEYKERLDIHAKKEGHDSLSAFVLSSLTKHMDNHDTRYTKPKTNVMNWRIKKALEEASVLIIELAVFIAFAGICLLIGYHVGHDAGQGDGFIQAYNYLNDMHMP
jgi:hypothetical protein